MFDLEETTLLASCSSHNLDRDKLFLDSGWDDSVWARQYQEWHLVPACGPLDWHLPTPDGNLDASSIVSKPAR